MDTIKFDDHRSILINKKLLELMKKKDSNPNIIKKFLQNKNYLRLEQTSQNQQSQPSKSETKSKPQKLQPSNTEKKSKAQKGPNQIYKKVPQLSNTPREEYKKYHKIKIGITAALFDRLHTNGHKFNTILWYDFFTVCGYDVYFLVRENVIVPKGFKSITFTQKDMSNVAQLDIVCMIGVLDQSLLLYCKAKKKRFIYMIMGSTYHNDVRFMLDPGCKRKSQFFDIQEAWMSPHFEFCREYYKIKYKTDNIFIGPYFWREDLFVKDNVLKHVNKNFLKLKVAIVEPNIELAKNCLIPISICEKANKWIDHVFVFNAAQLKDNICFKSFVCNTTLQKDRKISIEARYPFGLILSRHANCVVSCVRDCELNYIYLECFYLGIPLIHNSKKIKEYGYYYPDYDVTKGAEQVKNVLMNHNRQKYIEKHKPLLEKYSIYNPMYHTWVHERINNTGHNDCFD